MVPFSQRNLVSVMGVRALPVRIKAWLEGVSIRLFRYFLPALIALAPAFASRPGTSSDAGTLSGTSTGSKGPSGKSGPRELKDSWPPPRPVIPEPGFVQDVLLVGIVVNGKEVDNLEILRIPDGLLIPLDAFVALTGCTLVREGGAWRIQTPAGTVALTGEDVREVGGVRYLQQAFIETRLLVKLQFDQRAFALILNLPWRVELETKFAQKPLEPEIMAPGHTLSRMRAEAGYRSSRGTETIPTAMTLSGRLADGIWRVRYDYEVETGRESVPEYTWLRAHDNWLFQLGKQQIRMHPLLHGFDFTGGQASWTNRRLERLGSEVEGRELLARSSLPLRNFRGKAPPGGRVQLRIEGVLVRQQNVGLNGIFEFADVIIPARQVSLIEILVFDRDRFQTPIEVREYTITSSELLLPEGVVTHLAGVGSVGNLAEQAIDAEEKNDEWSGFYQYRQAVTQGLTLEAMVQKPGEEVQVLAGGIARLGEQVVSALALAASESGDPGYSFDLEGRYDRWWLLARSLSMPTSLRTAKPASLLDSDIEDHSIEVRFRANTRLELALLGRKRRDDRVDTEFLLPALSWRPTNSLTLRARPDNEGEYRYELYQRFNSRSRLTAIVHETAFVDFSYRLNPSLDLMLVGEQNERDDRRFSAILHHYNSRITKPSYRVGVFVDDGEAGALVGGSMQVLPGLYGRAELRTRSTSAFDFTDDGAQFTVSLVSDLSFSAGRVRPANPFNRRLTHGSVAGKIKVVGESGISHYSLKDIYILVGGRKAVKTDAWGNFFLGNMREGVYRLTIDPSGLPIELMPVKASYTVEVVAGATTGVDFLVRPQFGIAGRIRDQTGAVLAGIQVRLVTGDGEIVGEGVTDQFGLYRIDGLSPGTYRLTVPVQEGLKTLAQPPSRPVVVADDFLFGQDLTVPIR